MFVEITFTALHAAIHAKERARKVESPVPRRNVSGRRNDTLNLASGELVYGVSTPNRRVQPLSMVCELEPLEELAATGPELMTSGAGSTRRALGPQGGGMALRLVASADGDALALRDHLVPLIRDRGIIERQRDAVRVVTLHGGEWRLEHWTPFSEIEPGEASSPGYRHALARQHTLPDLPYGLDVWHSDVRVLSVLWDDGGSFQVAVFTRGDWEKGALAL